MRLFLKITLIALLACFNGTLFAVEWPQEIVTAKGTIVIYQPQPEKLEGNKLFGRSAMSLELKDSSQPIFGVFWFNAQIDTDQDEDLALVHTVRVDKIRWPESKKKQEERLSLVIENWVEKAGFEISMKGLSASLVNAELQQKSLAEIKNDPPQIIFKESLSVLLMFDGKPRFVEIKDSSYKRAVNTPFMVASNAKQTAFHLSNGAIWYQSDDPLGPWKKTNSPPKELVEMLASVETKSSDTESQTTKTESIAPEVVVATEATELVVSSGKPNWASLAGGKLLYVKNTETPWLRELSTNQFYVLLSGRWFSAKTLQGPWEFVRSDELPDSFVDIPPASDIGGVRTSIAGTEEANDALLDFQIPQTAAIKRSETKLEVKYDGKPDFQKISGTSVYYGVNTAAQVLRIGMQYYAVDNGVWFVSPSAAGPWRVADNIPTEQIAEIPPSSPVYNTTYVQVYHSTPQVVYVGYTPGYMWSFPYYGVPVYGSGWYYPPYYGRYYYPRPVTWGMHAGYNPYTGWNYGVSWSNGFLTVGFQWSYGYGGGYGCCYGYHGGYYGGYHGPIIVNRGPVIINNGDINIGNNINIGNQGNIAERLNNNPNFDSSQISKDNLYNRAENISRNADKQTVKRDFQKAREAKGLSNDVFADRDGNVVRRNNDGWQSRKDGQWQNATDLNRKRSAEDFQRSLKESQNRANRTNRNERYDRQQHLNNAHNARQIGSNRSQMKPRTKGSRRR